MNTFPMAYEQFQGHIFGALGLCNLDACTEWLFKQSSNTDYGAIFSSGIESRVVHRHDE